MHSVTARLIRSSALALLSLPVLPVAASDWQPVSGKMMTRWARDVTPQNVWLEYPRPQFERKNWANLNGLWDYAVTQKTAAQPTDWSGKILVPFAIESSLSGVGKPFLPDQALWYRRGVTLQPQSGHRFLLNFEAVDHQAAVWVNGQLVGEHIGGNTAFSLDITKAAKKGDNEITVRVWDETGGIQLIGKQTLKPGGIFYNAVSGIWQTVWLEEVPSSYLKDVKLTTAITPATITVKPGVAGGMTNGKVRATAWLKGKKVAAVEGSGELKLAIADAKLWSPAHPDLYDLQIELLNAKDEVVESVKSYAGIREVGKRRDANGNWRFTLNGEEIFHFGPLDQGWWPDGLLTPPSDAAMRADIEFLKEAGFNMIRKHIKVEPRRYYAHCDRIGMLIWQDQVACLGKTSDGTSLSPKWTRLAPNPPEAEWSDADHAQWMREMKAMMDELHNQSCIAVWVPFNEASGQHRTLKVGEWVDAYDPTRLVNTASGGNFWPVGDVADFHSYPNPSFPFEQERFNDYVKVVGEYGGLGWLEPGHIWDEKRQNWGYGKISKTKEELFSRYEKTVDLLADLKSKGVSAGVYTQTTDVEDECNGLMTYDRAVIKIPAAKLAEWHKRLAGVSNGQ
ncbi:MAG: sugar-binding domain-containing protein [Verrucomicrobiota bacterium]